MKNGAQPSESVIKLFKSVGLQDRFERYKKGESLEALMEESKQYYAQRVVNPKTRETSMKS
jgi:small subunit ribosomal protein S16